LSLEARLRPVFLAALAGDRAGHSVADAAKAAGMSEAAAKVSIYRGLRKLARSTRQADAKPLAASFKRGL
jgi:DNA-directed RNA polymerase specialized sigma24 family protein